MDKYAADHYAQKLEKVLEQVRDIMYELRILDIDWHARHVDEDEPELTLQSLQWLAKKSG